MKASDYVANWQNSWVIANWKMNPSTQLTVTALMTDLQQQIPADALQSCNVVVAPSFIHLSTTQQAIQHGSCNIGLAAQDLCAQHADKGAFTGEVSGAQLKDAQVNYVLVGHSERRQYFNEDDACLIQKIRNAFARDLTVIFCLSSSKALCFSSFCGSVKKSLIASKSFRISMYSIFSIIHFPFQIH